MKNIKYLTILLLVIFSFSCTPTEKELKSFNNKKIANTEYTNLNVLLSEVSGYGIVLLVGKYGYDQEIIVIDNKNVTRRYKNKGHYEITKGDTLINKLVR